MMIVTTTCQIEKGGNDTPMAVMVNMCNKAQGRNYS